MTDGALVLGLIWRRCCRGYRSGSSEESLGGSCGSVRVATGENSVEHSQSQGWSQPVRLVGECLQGLERSRDFTSIERDGVASQQQIGPIASAHHAHAEG